MSPSTPELETAPLGTTGMDITRVGFGAWATGGGGWSGGWGSQEDADSIAAIRLAVSEGVNWVDTAPAYGMGRSEEVVGRALRDIPEADRPYVFTKCGLVFDPADPGAGPSNVLAPESIRREVEDSLRRLGVDRIDLYQVHWPPTDGTPLAEYRATMQDLKRDGKVRAVVLHLTPQDLAELSAAVRDSGAGEGPAEPGAGDRPSAMRMSHSDVNLYGTRFGDRHPRAPRFT